MRRPSGDERGRFMGLGIGIGIALGAALGLALDNLALGIGVGVAIGVAIGAGLGSRNRGGGGLTAIRVPSGKLHLYLPSIPTGGRIGVGPLAMSGISTDIDD